MEFLSLRVENLGTFLLLTPSANFHSLDVGSSDRWLGILIMPFFTVDST
jgi:hypothetical protein